MLDRTSQLDDGLCGAWSCLELEAMDSKFCEAVERAFARGLERRESARAVFRAKSRAQLEEEAIQQVWIWFCRHTDEEDIAFVDVVARVRALSPNVTTERVRAGFKKRFEANLRVKFGG
jgi:hypothetical protein